VKILLAGSVWCPQNAAFQLQAADLKAQQWCVCIDFEGIEL
jgi:hypothetical protein